MTPRASAPEARANERDLMAHLKALIRERVPLETGCPLCDEIKGRLGAAPAGAPTREALTEIEAEFVFIANSLRDLRHDVPVRVDVERRHAERGAGLVRALLAARPDADACAATLRVHRFVNSPHYGARPRCSGCGWVGPSGVSLEDRWAAWAAHVAAALASGTEGAK